MTVARCPNRLIRRGECGTVLREHIDGLGRVNFRCPRCEARARGLCWQCGRPRTNDPKRGLLCTDCAHASYRQAQVRCEASQERKQKRKAYDRQRWQDPERRERKKAQRAAWFARNPHKVAEYKRREALNPTPRRKERERWWNAQPERAAKKRKQALAAYYEQHPVRPSPKCRTCKAAISWSPPGRPPAWCDDCVPDSVRRKRVRRREAIRNEVAA